MIDGNSGAAVARGDEGATEFNTGPRPAYAPAPAIDPPTLPVFTYDQIANQLTSTYWGGDSHHFNVLAGGSLTVNLTALNAVGQLLAREALATWTDIIGIQFTEVSAGGQIVFDDVDDGANPHANAVYSGGVTTSATINVPREWLVANGTTLDSYSFQSYMHEIGHALGLGHAGDYNTEANYAVDASFQNDSWATTIMSYFSQAEATYFADRGFTWSLLGTPMNGDVVAAVSLYGASTTTRTGNTTYGFNSTADRAIFDASQFTTLAYTIFDSAGIDTLDYSLSAAIQTIDLNPEQFSNVLGGIGNVVIARGVTIENAVGGGGNDTIRGNAAVNDLRGGAGIDTIDGGAGNDRLDGGSGNDRLSGGAGNDTYYVDSTYDVVTERAGEGLDIVFASASTSLRANVERLTLTGTASITGRGNELANIIIGNSGANVIDGGAGADTMEGGAGNDAYVIDVAGDVITEASGGGIDEVRIAMNYTLGTNLENLRLTGTASISGTGNAVSNIIYGNAGANLIDGAAGADSLRGGDGDDTYLVDNVGDRVLEASAAGGIDLVRSQVSFALSDYVDNLILLGSAVRGTGNAQGNVITGTSAANVMDGRGGADTLNGGLGNDLYFVDDAADIVFEDNTAGGIDDVRSSVSFALAANVEILRLTGTAAINATGNELANTIYGNAGANIIDGGAGADSMRGGDSNDVYIVDDARDRVIEAANGGYFDEVQSSVTHRLGSGVEKLVLTGSNATNGTGNELENTIIGNAAANVLNGLAGRDWMEGGAGNDTYYVDHVSDIVVEKFGEGDDTVRSSVNFTLSSDIEILILTGTAVSGTGGFRNNRIYGNSSDNILDGAGGADRLEGFAGNDTYYVDNAADLVIEASGGGTDTVRTIINYTLTANVEALILVDAYDARNATGNDAENTLTGNLYGNILDGGAGADTMIGGNDVYGDDNDVYYVDNAGDLVVETATIVQNTDTVRTSVDYALVAHVERLELIGTASINGTGNSLANYIGGNEGNNILDGGGGVDILQGFAGDDTYVIDVAGETIWELSGNDTVRTYISYDLPTGLENLVLMGTAGLTGNGNSVANTITGNSGANWLWGGAGNDTISGGAGNDWIDGTEGNDILTGGAGTDTFRISSQLTAQNVDVITDFGVEDVIQLWEGRFPMAVGPLAANAFFAGTAAQDQYDRIIYDGSTGNLYYDADGTGATAQILIAQLPSGLALTVADFIIGG